MNNKGELRKIIIMCNRREEIMEMKREETKIRRTKETTGIIKTKEITGIIRIMVEELTNKQTRIYTIHHPKVQ